jgi:hypothetical protein
VKETSQELIPPHRDSAAAAYYTIAYPSDEQIPFFPLNLHHMPFDYPSPVDALGCLQLRKSNVGVMKIRSV